jgi:hypothetical protein
MDTLTTSVDLLGTSNESDGTPKYDLSTSAPIIFEQVRIVSNQYRVVSSSSDHDDTVELDPEEEAGFYQAVRGA